MNSITLATTARINSTSLIKPVLIAFPKPVKRLIPFCTSCLNPDIMPSLKVSKLTNKSVNTESLPLSQAQNSPIIQFNPTNAAIMPAIIAPKSKKGANAEIAAGAAATSIGIRTEPITAAISIIISFIISELEAKKSIIPFIAENTGFSIGNSNCAKFTPIA